MRPRRSRREQGFTFTEVLIVLAVICVLTAVFVPVYLSQLDRARDAAVRQGVRDIRLGLSCYRLDHDDGYPMTVSGPKGDAPLVDDHGQNYLSSWPKNPWTGDDMRNVPKLVRGDFSYEGRSEVAVTGVATPLVNEYRLRGWLVDASNPFVLGTSGP
jgi:prepilin-type N-terminal cleavage/methylation domain-containing protein